VDILLDSDFDLIDFRGTSDEELAVMAKSDKSAANAVALRFLRLICIKAELYAGSDIDSDDLRQEGLLGLLSAIASFDPSRGVKFSTFAETCIVNRMFSFLSKARKTSSESLDDAIKEQLSEDETPESIYINKEFYSEFFKYIASVLSEKELKVFNMCIQGSSYKEVAEKLGMSVKAVDNAMQRARRKIRDLPEELQL